MIVDLRRPDIREAGDELPVFLSEQYVLAKTTPKRVVDPRSFHMAYHGPSADKALDGGAVFIIFIHEPYVADYLKCDHPYTPEPLEWGPQFPVGLTADDTIRFECEHGRRIKLVGDDGPFTNAVKKRLNDCEFFSTFEVSHRLKECFMPIATNKADENVAGVLVGIGAEGNGIVLLVPQIADKTGFLVEMMEEVLPDFRPDLFPYIEKPHWKEHGEYDLPIVSDMRQDIRTIQEDADRRIAEISQKIDEERKSTSYLLDLLTGNDTLLANAVKKTLESFCFQPVDSDEEMAKIDSKRKKMEDFHIDEPGMPILLVEAKGVSHKVTDEDALAVAKYIPARMREWKTTDIIGLSIINQNRGTPAIERDNECPFRDVVLLKADQDQIGLLTSFDLYRLGRSYITLGWKPENVKPVFYQKGRIHPVPTHYHLLGAVEGFREKAKAVGIRIEQGKLNPGDRIAYELPLEFVEQGVSSIQVDNQPVEKAEAGVTAGVLTDFGKVEMKKGVRVFLVKR